MFWNNLESVIVYKINNGETHDVRKWANDWRVSECTTRIGEISKLKKVPADKEMVMVHHFMAPRYIYITNLANRSHRVVGECLQEYHRLPLPTNHVQTLWCYTDVCWPNRKLAQSKSSTSCLGWCYSYHLSIQGAELSGDDLDEILEHIQRFASLLSPRILFRKQEIRKQWGVHTWATTPSKGLSSRPMLALIAWPAMAFK